MKVQIIDFKRKEYNNFIISVKLNNSKNVTYISGNLNDENFPVFEDIFYSDYSRVKNQEYRSRVFEAVTLYFLEITTGLKCNKEEAIKIKASNIL